MLAFLYECKIKCPIQIPYTTNSNNVLLYYFLILFKTMLCDGYLVLLDLILANDCIQVLENKLEQWTKVLIRHVLKISRVKMEFLNSVLVMGWKFMEVGLE